MAFQPRRRFSASDEHTPKEQPKTPSRGAAEGHVPSKQPKVSEQQTKSLTAAYASKPEEGLFDGASVSAPQHPLTPQTPQATPSPAKQTSAPQTSRETSSSSSSSQVSLNQAQTSQAGQPQQNRPQQNSPQPNRSQQTRSQETRSQETGMGGLTREDLERVQKRKAEQQALFEQRKKMAEQLKEIKLSLVFEALNGEEGIECLPNQDGDSNKWKIPSEGNIITKGQTWQNTMSFKKGYGGISLVMMALHLEFRDALNWMIDKFADSLTPEMMEQADEVKQELLFSPPEFDARATEEARRYLINTRGLPPSLIEREIKRSISDSGVPGGLYGAHPLDAQGRPMQNRYNAIFRGPASAEVRGIAGSSFKGCLGGSLPEHSGYRVMHAGEGEAVMAMTEAAIDALSYHTLFPGRFTVSTNGSGSRFPLQYKLSLEMLERGFGVRAAFDADAAGDFTSQRLCNALIVRKILAHQLKVDESQIDAWMLDETIEFLPSESPHENFFNLGWQPALPKYVSELVDTEDGKKIQWKDTGTLALPTIRLAIKKNLHAEWPRTQERALTIGQRAYAYVVNDLDLRRDRPLKTKDWNDDLAQLGPRYVQAYEQYAKQGYPEHLIPELPEPWAELRKDTEWVFSNPPPQGTFQPKTPQR